MKKDNKKFGNNKKLLVATVMALAFDFCGLNSAQAQEELLYDLSINGEKTVKNTVYTSKKTSLSSGLAKLKRKDTLTFRAREFAGVSTGFVASDVNFSAPIGEVARSAEGELISTQIHPTGISKFASLLRNSVLPVHGGVAAGFAAPTPTLDSIKDNSVVYLEADHSKYSTLDNTLSPTKGTHTNSVVIGGTTYYYTPSEGSADKNTSLINLVSTGSVAMIQGDEDNYVFYDGTNYWTYDKTKLPISIYDLTEVTDSQKIADGDWNIRVILSDS